LESRHVPEYEKNSAIRSLSSILTSPAVCSLTGTTNGFCPPSNIKYPQDFVFLNEAGEKLEEMIDYFHKTYHP